MSNQTNIVFRCDGNSKIGLGHVYRLLALAQYLENDFEIFFAIAADSDSKIIPSNYGLHLLPKDLLINDEPSYFQSHFKKEQTIFVIDGYQFNQKYVNQIFENFKLVYIDDIHAFQISADLVLNHSGGLNKELIKVNPLTKLCVGPDYAILRKSFIQKRNVQKSEIDILICFGGADPTNETLKTILEFDNKKSIAVIVGGAYLFLEELNQIVSENTKIYQGISENEMADLMCKSKKAILSASTVAYEFLAVSNGQLFIKQTADNQKFLYQYLIDSRAANTFDKSLNNVTGANQIIDGNSPKRIIKEFQILEKELVANLRRARSSDVDIVFNWINDTEVRSQSYSSEKISKEVHIKWFESKLISETTGYYIIEYLGQLVGQIRFEINNKSAIINYLIAPEFRKQGWAGILLKLGSIRIINDFKELNELVGFVKANNLASRHSFKQFNFIESEASEQPDSFKYILKV